MAKTFWIMAFGWATLFLCLITIVNFPLTNTETRESYNAYTVAKTRNDTNGKFMPLLFKADGNYISSAGVYLRVLSIHVFGLNNFGIRFAGVIVGILALYIFYSISKKIFKDKLRSSIALIVFSVSPLFLKSALFDIGQMSILILFMGCIYCLFFLENKKRNKFLKISTFLLVLYLTHIFIFEKSYIKFIKDQSVLPSYYPSNYTYLIDKRLSFGLIYGSPLITEKFNFNRISLNKAFYGVNEIFKSVIKPFNFESIFSPFQAQTILAKESPGFRSLPLMYFWEIPALLLAFITIKNKDKRIFYMIALSLVILLINKNKLLLLILPAIVLYEAYLITNYKKFVFVAVFILFNSSVFLSILVNRIPEWANENDFRQFKVWSEITQDDIDTKRIVVTDRIGEPVFYYLVYKNIDPKYFFENKHDGGNVNNEINRINGIGNVYFKSFNFPDEPKNLETIWVGTGKDFKEKNDEIKIVSTK